MSRSCDSQSRRLRRVDSAPLYADLSIFLFTPRSCFHLDKFQGAHNLLMDHNLFNKS
ncbi:unnamed protein product [Nesidiocoris tenuis]|uniref:Uncharacterized protein n=1 Tax=Nesidiocoris tenuis TaxID=355587 RepID=A0A6H5GUS1_9HEMI|nr:unnamed protein product [Nesidiocoris tenuis]